jgi:hypothetical protein
MGIGWRAWCSGSFGPALIRSYNRTGSGIVRDGLNSEAFVAINRTS